MSQRPALPRIDELISRRSLLRAGVATAGLAALAGCGGSLLRLTAGASPTVDPNLGGSNGESATPSTAVGQNVVVSNDQYGVHVEPSVATNPLQPGQLLAACQASPSADPEFIATYFSSDGGASWQNGGLPPQPVAGPVGDDVTVAFDGQGHGYLCGTRAGHGSNSDPGNPDANRAVYVWRTDDGGRSFSAAVTLLEGQYCDHPWLATGHAQASPVDAVYVVWGAGDSHTALDLTRSHDGGKSFESPRRILAEAAGPSVASAGPELATGPDGLVCAVCDWTTQQDASGNMVGQVVAVCSTDAGDSFAAPVVLGSEAAVIALPGNVSANSSPAVAASPQGDALYVAFPTYGPGAPSSDIVVTVSRDRGRTWSELVTATPHDDVIYFQPNLAVDEVGRVAVSAFALANGRVDVVLLLSGANELRFGAPLRVTTTAFDPHSPTASNGKHGAWWIGDYQGIARGPGAVHLVWNDTRTGELQLFAATVGT
jgi:hypothetical protein